MAFTEGHIYPTHSIVTVDALRRCDPRGTASCEPDPV